MREWKKAVWRIKGGGFGGGVGALKTKRREIVKSNRGGRPEDKRMDRM